MNHQLHLDVFGSGPNVVVVHGMPSDPQALEAVAEALSSRFRVWVPHLPGYGASKHLETPNSWKNKAEMLTRLLQTHGVDRAHLVGFSAGAALCYTIACEGILRVDSLYLLSGAIALNDMERDLYRDTAHTLELGGDISAQAPERFLSATSRANISGADDLVRGWFTSTPKTLLARELRALVDGLPAKVSPLPNTPVTVRKGTLDPVVSSDHLAELASILPHANIELAADCGHVLFVEDHDATLESIAHHLSKHSCSK